MNKLEFHFRRHTCPGGRCQRQVIQGFIVDFYCHKAALVVEVDGDSPLRPIGHIPQMRRCKLESAFRLLLVGFGGGRAGARCQAGEGVVRFRNDEVVSDLSHRDAAQSAVVEKTRELIKK